MKNRLIPLGKTEIVWVVSVNRDGGHRPLAVVGSESDALQLCKLIGMNAPEQKPRRDAVWMPVEDG